MPVTTRAVALRSGANGNLNHSQDQTASTPTVPVKATRKCPPRRKQTSAQVHSVASSAECETHPPSQQQLRNLDPASKVIHRSDREDLNLSMNKSQASSKVLFTLRICGK